MQDDTMLIGVNYAIVEAKVLYPNMDLSLVLASWHKRPLSTEHEYQGATHWIILHEWEK